MPTTAEKDLCSGKHSGGYTIRANGSNLQAQFYVGGAYRYAEAPLTAGTWTHAVATYDGSAVSLYVNGRLAATTPVTGTVTPPTGSWFGVGADTSATGTAEFPAPASIATVRIYSGALPADSVLALARAEGLAPKAPTPDVLDVDFRDGKPTERVATMPATTHGTPTFGTDATVTPGVASTGTMTVDGVDDAVSFPAFASQWSKLSSGFTFECVVRIDVALPTANEKDLCSDKEAGGASLYVNGSNLGFSAHVGGGYKIASAPVDGQRWYHVLGTWDGSAVRLYVNGALVATTAATGALTIPPNATARHFVIGGDASPGPAVGQWAPPSTYAAAGVFARAVTADEALLLAQEWDTTPPTPKADVLDVDFADGTAKDAAQGLTLTRLGDPQIGAEEALGRDVVTLDGTDDALSYGFGEQWSKLAGGFSLECTFRFNRPLPVSTENAVCSDKEAGGFATVVTGSGITFMAYVGGGYRSVAVPAKSGQWYHTLATWDGSTVKVYVDGQLAGSTAATGTLGLPSGNAKTAFMVGADTNTSAGGQFWSASTVANARIYSRALSAPDALGLNVAALGETRDAKVQLRSTTPATGARITKPVEFAVDVERQASATGWTYLLDGTPVNPGQRIGAGLRAGAHTLVVTATDVFGKALRWEVPFTSADIPSEGGTDTGQGNGRVTLSTIARSNDGGDVTTTFTQATTTSAEGGVQGVVPVLPTSLTFTYEQGAPITGALAPDGTTFDSVSTGRIPFQRYDLAIASYVEGQEIVWTGVVDPERAVTLRAWNTTLKRWDVLDTARGSAEGDTTLAGAVRPALLDPTSGTGVVHVLVTGEDPFADDLSPHDSSAQADKDRFQDPADYDFSLAHFTDTQYLAEGAAGGTYDDWDGVAEPSDVMTIEEQAVWQRAYLAETEWLRDNAGSRKIAYAAHTGDVIENDYYDPLKTDSQGKLLYPGLDEQVDRELAFTSGAQGILDGAGLVNQVIAGNHDNQLGVETGPTSRFSRTFSADRYYQAAKGWPTASKASFHAWDEQTDASGAVTVPGKDSQNNYVLFSAGGLDFVAVGLSYGVTAEEAAWAGSVFERYHDRNGILLTHAYLAPSTAPDGRGAGFSTDGSRLFDQVVKANPNVFLVLSGHEHGVGTNLKSGIGATVAHDVVELLADYQFYKVSAGELFPGKADANGNIDLDGDGVTDRKASDMLQFGASFMRLLQFDVERSEVTIDTYSPLLKNFGATEYDDRKRYNGSEDNLTLPVDLSSRTTSFGTDGLTVVTPGTTVIGTATARSGWPASVTWSGLQKGEVYAWTATSRNAAGEEVGTVDQFGGVFVATARGTDTTAPVLTVPPSTTVTQGEAFDPMTGVRAVDDSDGDVSSRVQVVGSVDVATPGSYALTYLAADTNGNQVAASRSVTVRAIPVPDKTSTKVTSRNAAATFGVSTLTLSADVSPATATGTVTFLTGEEVWCTAPVVRGAASCSPQTLPPPGSYAVRAIYSGDTTHAGSEVPIVVSIAEAPAAPAASVGLSAGPTALAYGEAATVTVSASGVPAGSVVTLRDGTRTLASTAVTGGVATIALPARSLAPGAHVLTASYAGASTTVPVTVAKVASSATVKAKRLTRGKVRVKVAVTAGSEVTASGTVTVRVGSRIRTVALNGGGARIVLPVGGKRRVTVSATWAGDAFATGSSARTTLTLRK
nr:LamG-like jellyroll fold domain-containing protein [Nocardioides flavescens]